MTDASKLARALAGVQAELTALSDDHTPPVITVTHRQFLSLAAAVSQYNLRAAEGVPTEIKLLGITFRHAEAASDPIRRHREKLRSKITDLQKQIDSLDRLTAALSGDDENR